MYIVILITASSEEEAKKISNGLIEEKLAACVNIVKDIQSVFWWDQKVDHSKEVLLIVKSKESMFDRIVKKVKLLHSYDTPEVIALPIIRGDKKYLDWMDESIKA